MSRFPPRSRLEPFEKEGCTLGNTRVRCLACGTEQEAPDPEGPGACEICGTPLRGGRAEASAEASAEELVLVEDTEGSEPREPEEGEPRRTPPRFDELLAAQTGAAGKEIDELVDHEKRVVTILSLVPVWGTLRLWQSDLHTDGEKIRWTIVSGLLTLAIVAILIGQIPGTAERTAVARQRIDADLDELASLVERFREDSGEYPGPEAWASSVERGDSRFFDPWNRAYHYRLEPDAFVLVTHGRDGVVGGTGEDADVSRRVPLESPPPEDEG